MIEESQREGSYMPIEEDEHGTYVMNSKDLRAIEHVKRLVDIGVDSLKIEGRTKSPYYVARTVQSYRRAIDDAVAGRELDPALLGQLEGPGQPGLHLGLFPAPHAGGHAKLPARLLRVGAQPVRGRRAVV